MSTQTITGGGDRYGRQYVIREGPKLIRWDRDDGTRVVVHKALGRYVRRDADGVRCNYDYWANRENPS